MQFLRLLPLAIISISLSACIFEKDTGKSESSSIEDKTSIQPIKEIKKEANITLVTNSDYIPQDGDHSVNFIYIEIFGNNKLLVQDQYFDINNYSYVTELPNQFGYQHLEAGPYIRAESFKQYSETNGEKTSVRYITQAPPHTLLINHDLNDHVYSIAEFNQHASTSSHENDGVITEGETLTYTGQEQLFDELSGNAVGLRSSTSNVTALELETIIIRSGTFQTAKASYKSEATNIIHANASESWTQINQGFMWFDINTGTVLKTTLVGSFVRADYPSQTLTTNYYSEFVSSDEYNKAAMTISASDNHSKGSINNIALQGVIKNNRIISNRFSTQVNTGSYLGKLAL